MILEWKKWLLKSRIPDSSPLNKTRADWLLLRSAPVVYLFCFNQHHYNPHIYNNYCIFAESCHLYNNIGSLPGVLRIRHNNETMHRLFYNYKYTQRWLRPTIQYVEKQNITWYQRIGNILNIAYGQRLSYPFYKKVYMYKFLQKKQKFAG